MKNKYLFQLIFATFVVAVFLGGSLQAAKCKKKWDRQDSRIALISAFSGEASAFVNAMGPDKLNGPVDHDNCWQAAEQIDGFRYVLGVLHGKSVVIVLTNISIANSAMVTEKTLDSYNVRDVIFSGIAGGVGGVIANNGVDDNGNAEIDDVDEAVAPIGSVAIPQRWGYSQEMYFANSPDFIPCAGLFGLQLNGYLHPGEELACTFTPSSNSKPENVYASGVINGFFRDTNVASSSVPQFTPNTAFSNADQKLLNGILRTNPTNPFKDPAQQYEDLRFWFPVDDGLFNIAKTLANLTLYCAKADGSLTTNQADCGRKTKLVLGGNGIAGPTFVDNKAVRGFFANTLNFDDTGSSVRAGIEYDSNNPTADHTDVVVLDMETPAAAHVARSHGVPFIAVRGVSDLAGGEAGAQFNFGLAVANQSLVVLTLLQNIP